MADLFRSLIEGRPAAAEPELPVTGRVVKVTTEGAFVVPLEADTRYPIGPCRGPGGVTEGDVVLLVFTQDRPWVALVDQTPYVLDQGGAV